MSQQMRKSISITRKIYPDNKLMGKGAAEEIGGLLRQCTADWERPALVNFAAAPSQDTMLEALAWQPGIDWQKVQAIHLDEYFDLPRNHPNTFEAYLREHIFSRVPIPPENIHYIKAIEAQTPEELADAYEAVVREVLAGVRAEQGIYLACIGIGVNGHIGFNEPYVDKRTGRKVIPVEIDEVSVRQQHDDYKDHPNPAARYATLQDVPRRAVTMSCAGILAADQVFCIVPGAHKAAAVRQMWEGTVSDDAPASLLRMHPRVTLYLDADSAAQLDAKPEPQ